MSAAGLLLIIAMLVLTGASGGAEAAEPAAPLRFRRVLVGEQDVDRVVRGLLPMRREEFDRRVKMAEAAGQIGASPVRIASAQYRARLEGDGLVDGEMELAVLYEGSAPALLDWGAADLAVHKARWSGQEGRDAPLGVEPGGRLVCLVPESGTLGASWSLRGRRDPRGDLVFQFHLPPSPLNEMTLVLPGELEVTAEGAIAQRLPASLEPAGSANEGVRWRLLCGSPGQVTLRVSKSSAQHQSQPLVLLKQQSAFTVHRGAIDVEASFEIDPLTQPLSRLVFSCEAALALVSVRQGDTRLDFQELADDAKKRQFAVEFSPPLVGGADAVRLTATMPWDGRGIKRLPAIGVAGATWQEGQISIAADDALGLEIARQSGCRTIGYVAATPSQPASTWQLQQLVADASVSVSLAESALELSEQSATVLEFGTTQIGGVFTAEVTASTGTHFELKAEIPRTWIVDNVDVQPADMLADRALALPMQSQSGAAPQLLSLALRRPLVSGRPLRLTVRAHQRRPPGDEVLPAGFFSMVKLRGVRDARRLLTWQVTDPAAQLSLSGDEQAQRMDAAALAPAQLRLFEAPPRGPVFDVTDVADRLPARLVRTAGNYRLDALVRATIDETIVREEWKLRFTPEDAAIDRIQVHCRPATGDLGQWRIEGEDPRDVIVRQLQPLADGSSQSVFEITFARPRQTSLEATAQFVRRGGAQRELSLVASPAATSQTGRVEIHALAPVQVAIAAEGLQAEPLDAAVARPETLRGLFRYDPGQTARLSWHTPAATQSLPLAWIESLDVESSCLPDGTARHQALFKIHSVGLDRFEFRIPGNPTAVQAQVGDRPVLGLLAGVGSEYSVEVSPRGNTEVMIRYCTRQSPVGWTAVDGTGPVGWIAPLGWSGASLVSCPAPTAKLPVLDRQWHVRLPAALAPLSPALRETIDSSTTVERYWTTYRVPWREQSVPSVWIARRSNVAAWSICLGLAAFACVVWWRCLSTPVAAGAMFAVLAWLLAPAPLTALPAAVFVGIVLGAGWVLVAPRRWPLVASQTEPRTAGTSTLWRQTAGAGVLLAIATAACPGQVAAPSRANDTTAVVRRVVIPVNDARQPVGDYVFLEPELYDALVAITERLSFATPDWLLTSAVYRPVMAAGAAEDSLRVDQIGATFMVETFRGMATVELDFRRPEIHLIERAARLDGEPVVLEWSEDGTSLRAAIDEPGKHRLELTFGASPQQAADGGSLELAIPRTAASRVELPDSPAGLHVDDPRGAASQAAKPAGDSPRGRVIEIGAASGLALRWSKSSADGAGPLRTEAEQLVLWTIRPGSVAAKGKLRVRPLGGSIRQLTVDLDARLRVLPQPAGGVVARQWLEQIGSTLRLHLELAEPAAAEVTVPLALVVADSSGIGSLTLPHIRVQADEVKRSWQALSLAGNLEWNPAPPARADDPSASAFAEAWGEALAAPIVTVNAQASRAPELHVQPTASAIAAQERLDCSFSQDLQVAHYVVELSKLMPDVQIHRLRCAAGLQVRRLELASLGVPVRAQWRQSADGDVVITQQQAAAETLQIKLEARRPMPSGETITSVPLVEYAGAAERQAQLGIWRQSDVRLKVTADTRRWPADDAAALGLFQEELGRLAAVYRGDRGFDRPPTVTVEPNQPEVTGHLLTRYEPSADQWSVHIDAALTVERGEVDELRLLIPAQLDAAPSITPAAEHEVVTAAGQTSLLRIRPQRALAQAARLNIEGHIAFTTAAMRLGAAVMPGAQRVRSLVALPANVAGQQFEWETKGLQSVDAAHVPAGLLPLPAGYELYEVVAAQHSALATARHADDVAPQVQRAVHRLRLTGEGRLAGGSQLQVLPRGARHVDLALPPSCRLLAASLDGVPAQLVDRGGATWRLSNLSGERQHQIAIDYVAAPSPPAQSGENRRFLPPSIGGATPGEVRWDLPPGSWTPLEDGSVLVPIVQAPISDWRWPAWLALAATALFWIVGQSTAATSGLMRLTPFWLALFGAGWMAAAPWPALGWLAIALALWLAVRSPWPRSSERPLSGVFGPAS